jgi:hypothetical protein
MKSIEVTVTPRNHIVQLPDDIPNGRPVRRVIQFDEPDQTQPEGDLKRLLTSVADGLWSLAT